MNGMKLDASFFSLETNSKRRSIWCSSSHSTSSSPSTSPSLLHQWLRKQKDRLCSLNPRKMMKKKSPHHHQYHRLLLPPFEVTEAEEVTERRAFLRLPDANLTLSSFKGGAAEKRNPRHNNPTHVAPVAYLHPARSEIPKHIEFAWMTASFILFPLDFDRRNFDLNRYQSPDDVFILPLS